MTSPVVFRPHLLGAAFSYPDLRWLKTVWTRIVRPVHGVMGYTEYLAPEVAMGIMRSWYPEGSMMSYSICIDR